MDLFVALAIIGVLFVALVLVIRFAFVALEDKTTIIETQHETISQMESDLTENAQFIVAMKRRAQDMYDHMKGLDTIGAFEADDDTGIFFIELKQMMTDINAYIQNDVEPIDIDEEVKKLEERIEEADKRKEEKFMRVFKRTTPTTVGDTPE